MGKRNAGKKQATINAKTLRRGPRDKRISLALKNGPGRPEAYSEAQVIAALHRS